jgi:hypothetical protein
MLEHISHISFVENILHISFVETPRFALVVFSPPNIPPPFPLKHRSSYIPI